MSRYTMVMGKGRTKRKKEEPDVIRWVLNLVVPLMTLFGVLNLVVSGEAIEGMYKFFKNTGPTNQEKQSEVNHIGKYANMQMYNQPVDNRGQGQGQFGPGQMGLYPPNQQFHPVQYPVGGAFVPSQGQYPTDDRLPQIPQSQQQQVHQQNPPLGSNPQQQINKPQAIQNANLGTGRAPASFDDEPEKPLLDPVTKSNGLSLNQFREQPSVPAAVEIDETDDEKDDDFQRGLDFENMVFDQSQKAPECPNLDGHDWAEDIKPKIQTDPNKFLVPVLFFGPNNQIHGLREAIILSIKLNRTLALPPFYKHHSNVQDQTPYADLVEATHRIDERALRHLIPIVKIEKLREACGAWFGVAFLARQVICSGNMFDRLASFEYYSKIHLLNHATLDKLRSAMGDANCELVSVTTQPPSDSLPEKRSLLLPENEVDLKTKIYKSDEACAAFLFPFKNYVFDPIIVKAQAAQISDDMRELMSQVIAHTPRPVYIKEVATMFIDEVIQKGDFVGIHWRYDIDDWLATNCKDGVTPFMQQKCGQIHSAREDPTVLARGVAKLIKYLEQKGATKTKIVYIATPLAEEEMVNKMTEWLNRETQIKVLSSRHLQTFFDHFYSNCDVTQRDWLDLLSILEQEVVYRSTVFIRSVVSSWSLNVQLQRSIEMRDKHDVTNWRLLT